MTVRSTAYEQGQELAAALKSEAALIAFEEAFKEEPTNYKAAFGVGLMLQRLGQHPEAVAAFSRVLRLEPRVADACYARALSLQILGRHTEARTDLNAALALRAADDFQAAKRLRDMKSEQAGAAQGSQPFAADTQGTASAAGARCGPVALAGNRPWPEKPFLTLREHFSHSGNWLFRWRSYVPLPLLGVALLGLYGFSYPGGSHALDLLWKMLCFAVGLVGLLIRILTIGHVPRGTSGRNQRQQRADALNTTGMYSLVRHPLYLGNYFMWLGVALLPRAGWVPLVGTLAFWLYYERIMFVEEEFLREKFGAQFLAWAGRTPAFFPAFRHWKPPDTPFSIRTVLRREYLGFCGLVVTFNIFESVSDVVATGHFQIDVFWVTLLGLTVLASAVLRILIKKTRILEVEGRS